MYYNNPRIENNQEQPKVLSDSPPDIWHVKNI